MNVQSYKDTHKVKCRESTYSAGSKSEIQCACTHRFAEPPARILRGFKLPIVECFLENGIPKVLCSEYENIKGEWGR